MIEKWKVSNFKSLSDETELEFGPLTILAGPNGAGKSAFIQTILLVAQSLNHKSNSQGLVLNGNFTNLGQFDEIKSDCGTDDEISIVCTCRCLPFLGGSGTMHGLHSTTVENERNHKLVPFGEIEWKLSFDTGTNELKDQVNQAQPRLICSEIACKPNSNSLTESSAFVSASIPDGEKSVNKPAKEDNEIQQEHAANSYYHVELDCNSASAINEHFNSGKLFGCKVDRLLPTDVILKVDAVEEDTASIVKLLLNTPLETNSRYFKLKDTNLPADITKILQQTFKLANLDFEKVQKTAITNESSQFSVQNMREIHSILSSENSKKLIRELENVNELRIRIYDAIRSSWYNQTKSEELAYFQPNPLISDSLRYLENYFVNSVKYLGHLRDLPKPVFPILQGGNPEHVGVRGEFTAELLEVHKNTIIEYVQPSAFSNGIIKKDKVEGTLETAIVEWLKYLNIGESLSVQVKQHGCEVMVGVNGAEANRYLNQVGAGVSQVLPILTMGLLASSDSTLIFEQPELHLHPMTQSLLVDFFYSLTLVDKQCVIETHSKHIFDQIRYRIAKSASNDDPITQSKFYFVEMKEQVSRFEEVKVNEYGKILNWPEGFFRQSPSMSEKIMSSAMTKRKSKDLESDG